jgi:predicted ArsR family transcriptional regulator
MPRKLVRLSLLRHLADRGTAGLDELADAADVHPNTARAHVQELEREGVIVREDAPLGRRGRPAARFRLRPGWRAHAAPLEGLARLLAETLVELDPGQEALERAGRAWGAGRDDGEVVAGLERLGFAVRRDGDTLVLAACPCPLVAPDRPDAVCRLARAVVEGYGVRIAEERHDPRRRHCRLRLYSCRGAAS